MIFRTEHTPAKPNFSIRHGQSIVLTGSCFSENIGRILQRYHFDVDLHSHGILFNPLSIAHALKDVITQKNYDESELLLFNENYFSLNHHGSFGGPSSSEVLNGINARISMSHDKIKSAKVLFITLGSSWAYYYKKTNTVVANCHKIPQQEFEKRLISHTEIESDLSEVLIKLRSLNPEIKVVFTISPVRHLRDGFFENQISKGNLFLAVHKLCDAFSWCSYFPAFEFVIDDLRDYRFFNDDMVHPNAVAINYVWEKLLLWGFDSETIQLVQKMEPILKFLDHRPMKVADSLHARACEIKNAELKELILHFGVKK